MVASRTMAANMVMVLELGRKKIISDCNTCLGVYLTECWNEQSSRKSDDSETHCRGWLPQPTRDKIILGQEMGGVELTAAVATMLTKSARYGTTSIYPRLVLGE
jgi:hypothetical protein